MAKCDRIPGGGYRTPKTVGVSGLSTEKHKKTPSLP